MIQKITGTVIHGKQLWRTLWYPTANVEYSWDLADWVYKMNIVHQWITYPGMGTYFADRELLEAHLFDVEIDLYDDKITIFALVKIRENQKFENMDALIVQIQQDEAQVRKLQWKVLTFGTFDHTHPGHISYLTQASHYGDQLITIIALDETVSKIKWFVPDHHQDMRLQAVQWFGIDDHMVVLWDPDNVYQCLHDREPQIICLGYDQSSFDDGILEYCDQHWLVTPTIIRLDSHHPDKYKSSILKKHSKNKKKE